MAMTAKQSTFFLTTALAYAARGWRVFPCHSIVNGRCTCDKGEQCTDMGKHPRTPHGCSDGTTNAAQIKRWWLQWPTANIGIATGKQSGFLVLDSDPKHNGPENLAALERIHGALPHTIESVTGSGGSHKAFAYPHDADVRNSASKLAPGVDVRGEGGYIIAPPSNHLSGRSYEWELSHHPDETALAPLPAWVLTLLQAAETGRGSSFVAPEEIIDGARNDTLFRLGCSLRAKGLSETVILAALRAENDERCTPPLSPEEVGMIAKSAARYEPGTSSHGQDSGPEPAVDPFTVDPKASPDSELLLGMLEADDRFRRTWEHRRKDLKTQAFEVYEYSLARQARTAEWETQEIVNLLIYHRRKYAAIQQTAAYYTRILQKTSIESDKTDEEGLADAETQEALAEGTAAVLTMLRDKLGIPLTHIIKRGKQDALYSFLLEGGEEIALGSVDFLMNAKRVKAKIYEVTLTSIKTFTEEQWRKIMNLFKPLVVEMDLGGERKELTREWISHYLDKAERTPFPRALMDSDPFIEDGNIYLNVMALRVYLNRNWMESIDDKAVRALLSELGFAQKTKSGRIKGKTYTRSYWHTAASFLGEDETPGE